MTRRPPPPVSGTARPPLTAERRPTGWALRDPALVRLADIDAVPLPFTQEASSAEVLDHLRRFNPHREVHVAPSAASGAGDIPLFSCA
ncbi:MAG: hypothetical protein AAFQ43_04760 [Bacteroidota bacterium]